MVARRGAAAGALVVAAALAGCGGDGQKEGGLRGAIEVDGSSTVYPITEAVAEEFIAATGRGVRVTVGASGTGGGFKRFCAGETAISNASRPMKASEAEACERNGVEYLELPVAYDGIAVVVHPDNVHARCLTVEELRRIWEPGSNVRLWSEIRPNAPAVPIRLYGPGTDSGTFDYFTEEIVGEPGASRADYTASEDDNVLVQGIAGDPNALGYFGFAYMVENRGRVEPVAIDAGRGCVLPTRETIESGEYSPLSRPVYIYVDRASLSRPEVRAFVRFYLENAAALVPEVGYVPLEPPEYRDALEAVGRAAGVRD